MNIHALENRIEQSHDKPLLVGGYILLAGVFSIPLLGTGAHNLLLGLPILLLLLSREIKKVPDVLLQVPAALFGVLLFLWLSISILWSDAGYGEGLSTLKKYRELILIPIFILYFSSDRLRRLAFAALYAALFISLAASYLIHFELIDITENEHSIGDRIFHGISMSFFAYMTLSAAFRYRKYLLPLLAVYVVTLHNLFFIENGRTGYLSILALTTLFFLQRWRLKKVLMALGFTAAVIACGFIFLDTSNIRLLEKTDLLLHSQQLSFDILQQTDIRLEYYILSARVFLDNWLLGVGLGSYPLAYENQMALQPAYWGNTVNPHNEFLMIACQAGIIGLILFGLLLVSVLLQPNITERKDRHFSQAVVCCIAIACLFNSSFLDHGDGTLFMILIALALSLAIKPSATPALAR